MVNDKREEERLRLAQLERELNETRRELGLAEISFGEREMRNHLVRVSDDAWVGLHSVAREHGFLWGEDRGKVGLLLEAIGLGNLLVVQRSRYDREL